jgi:hypothetical protein
MTQSYERIISNDEDAARFKADLAAVDGPTPGVKRWVWAGRYSSSDQAARAANFSPAQKEGEAIFSVLENGRCDLFCFL